jgi:hypothetical protein
VLFRNACNGLDETLQQRANKQQILFAGGESSWRVTQSEANK